MKPAINLWCVCVCPLLIQLDIEKAFFLSSPSPTTMATFTSPWDAPMTSWCSLPSPIWDLMGHADLAPHWSEDECHRCLLPMTTTPTAIRVQESFLWIQSNFTVQTFLLWGLKFVIEIPRSKKLLQNLWVIGKESALFWLTLLMAYYLTSDGRDHRAYHDLL